MNLVDVKNAAREHVQSITAIHPTRALPKPLLSKEVRSTGLASLVETLDIPASAKHTEQVGS